MKMKRLMTMLAATCAAMTVALAAEVPSSAEVREVGKYLDELTKGDRQSLSQKKTTKEQYGDTLVGYAADEKKPAAKFALFKEAFKAYADAKSWEKADGVYSSAQAEGGTEYALAVVGNVIVPGSAKELKTRIEDDKKSYRQIGIIKKKLKKTPGDEALCESLGLEYAAVGNWEGALAAFLTAPGEVAKVADWELNKGGAYTAAKAAKFWWDYADGKPKAKMEAVRLHAAMWYELALGENAYSGNEAKIVQGRIEETKSYGGAAMQEKATLAKQVNELKPIVLPLKGKTVIEFVGVPAGEFMMGTKRRVWDNTSLTKPHKVIITRPFWISKFQVTKEQWNIFQKAELTEYDKVMGGMQVPQGMSYMEAMEFCEWLTKRVSKKLPKGYIVRLPTEAEWEYALRINDDTWDDEKWHEKIDWFAVSVSVRDIRQRAIEQKYELPKDDWKYGPVAVGTKKPNAIGLYDMIGNGCEYVLDTLNVDSFAKLSGEWYPIGNKANEGRGLVYNDKEIDPLRFCKDVPAAVSIRRGEIGLGSPHLFAKPHADLFWKNNRTTLRLCIGPDLMKEKGYKFKLGKK